MHIFSMMKHCSELVFASSHLYRYEKAPQNLEVEIRLNSVTKPSKGKKNKNK